MHTENVGGGVKTEREKMATLNEVLEKNDGRLPEGPLVAFYNNDSYWETEDADDIIQACEDAYRGEYYNGEEYAEEMTSECCDIPENLRYYIDYARMWRDMEMGDGYYIVDRFVFSPC
jgi:hypothetical protein